MHSLHCSGESCERSLLAGESSERSLLAGESSEQFLPCAGEDVSKHCLVRVKIAKLAAATQRVCVFLPFTVSAR